MLVVADLPENVLMKELKILGEVPLRRKIQSIGYVPMQYLPVLYKHAEAFLYPSLRESFGLPIIEAMSCRVPVVTSKVAAMPEIAGEAAFLVDPTDPSAIADGIESALQDTPIRQQRIADGLERAHLFSWENAAERMISIYQSI
jgi:glycosyltransferase involved in cell wall biosynthesis